MLVVHHEMAEALHRRGESPRREYLVQRQDAAGQVNPDQTVEPCDWGSSASISRRSPRTV